MDLSQLTDAQLRAMSFDGIRKLREIFPDQASQNRLAPFDRSSFVREMMQERGPHAGIAPALVSPVFEALKFLPGRMGSRSEPSLQNALAGAVGFGQGLNEWNQSKITNKPRQIDPLNALR
jgi:hypothetical protein